MKMKFTEGEKIRIRKALKKFLDLEVGSDIRAGLCLYLVEETKGMLAVSEWCHDFVSSMDFPRDAHFRFYLHNPGAVTHDRHILARRLLEELEGEEACQ